MNLPSKEECEGWDQAQLAHFMYQNKMPECATTVKKLRINGQRFLNLSESEISKFSLIHQPQLQKIVQDIRKKDDSFLNKLRRFKSKPSPKVPERDYRGYDGEFDDQLSDPEYDNDLYEDLCDDQDGSYEPPPSQRAFTSNPSTSLLRGDYVDSCHSRPNRPPKKPLRPNKASKQLPPEPILTGSDEEDYISPDGSNDDDNYIEPDENQPANRMMPCRRKTGMDRPMLPTPPERLPSSDFYEVPDKEASQETSLSVPAGRLCSVSTLQSQPLPPTPSPRQNRSGSSPPVQDHSGEDEYEVCDPNDCSHNKAAERPPALRPKPTPRERSPKPPIRPKPDLRPRQFESQTLPVTQTDHRLPPKHLTLDLNRLKIPFPQFASMSTQRGSCSADAGSQDEDKDADVCMKPWYAGACDRRTADEALLHSNKDGAFMVRKSSGHDAKQPYTLVVFYKGRVYNIPIRFIANTQQFALGREKKGEEHFSSVSHIIENHQRNLLMLIDSQNNSKDATKLRYPMKP